MWYILNDDGEPVAEPDFLMASIWLDEHRQHLIVASDFIEHTDYVAHVSTVFLGLDHGRGDGPPVLWETMVFNGPLNLYQERYLSKHDALLGHAEAVRLTKEGNADA